MNHIKENVKTDLSIGELNKIRSNYKDADKTVNKRLLTVLSASL